MTTEYDITKLHGHPKYEKRADSAFRRGIYEEQLCACCGRKLSSTKTRHMAFTRYGGNFESPWDDREAFYDAFDEEAWVGFFGVGSDCAKKLNAAGVKTSKLNTKTGEILW